MEWDIDCGYHSFFGHFISNCIGLNSIKVNALNPIALAADGHFFNNVNRTTCTLYVPSGSLSDYQAATQWGTFEHIEEFDFSLLVDSDALQIEAAEGSTAYFEIHSNTEWSVSTDRTWLKVRDVWGIDNDYVVLTADANPTTSTRQATVTISGLGVNSKTIVVMKAAVSATGISTNTHPEISIYSNPVIDVLHINGAAGATLEVYNLQGSKVLSRKLETNNEIIDLSFLSQGVYLIKVDGKTVKINKSSKFSL